MKVINGKDYLVKKFPKELPSVEYMISRITMGRICDSPRQFDNDIKEKICEMHKRSNGGSQTEGKIISELKEHVND